MAHGYRLYWHLPHLFSARNYFKEPNNVFRGILSINMLGVPRSRDMYVQLHEICTPRADWRTTDRLANELDACDKALAANPGDADAHHRRGSMLAQQRRLREALTALDRALAIRSDFAAALADRARLLQELAPLPPAGGGG